MLQLSELDDVYFNARDRKINRHMRWVLTANLLVANPCSWARMHARNSSEPCVAFFSGLCSSVVLTAARLCCAYGKPRRAFGLGIGVALRSRSGRLGCAHLCAWVAARGLRSRVGGRVAGWVRTPRAVIGCRVACHSIQKQCSSGSYGSHSGYSVLTRGGRHVL